MGNSYWKSQGPLCSPAKIVFIQLLQLYAVGVAVSAKPTEVLNTILVLGMMNAATLVRRTKVTGKTRTARIPGWNRRHYATVQTPGVSEVSRL